LTISHTPLLNTPILFLVYQDVETTLLVFDRIREAKPNSLYIAADGPKSDDEREVCNYLRTSLLDRIDWDCEVYTLFRESNLGLKSAVSTALDWFFLHNEAGIILEYDCLPDITFFDYCSILLEKYQADERIFAISGNNIVADNSAIDATYFFSSFTPVWGWATWRRSWQHWDGILKHYDAFKAAEVLHAKLPHNRHRAITFWEHSLDDVHSGRNITTWAFCFNYYQLINSALCIIPPVNLVCNLGIGSPNATNSTSSRNPLGKLTSTSFTITYHPSIIVSDQTYDAEFSERASYRPLMHSLRRKISIIRNAILSFVSR